VGRGLGDDVYGVLAAYLFRKVADRDARWVVCLLADGGVLVILGVLDCWIGSLGLGGVDHGVLARGQSARLTDLSADSALPLPVA
jgi:hypothetical protein